MTFTQAEFDIRLEWGMQGVTQLAPISDVIIVVDVLSFSTSVEIATSRDVLVYPYRQGEVSAQAYAKMLGAELAEKGRGSKVSLSPLAMSKIPIGAKIVLPSPNGSTLSLATGTTPTLAGCLRNARACAVSASRVGRRIALIPAGERWPDGSLRPAFEDLIGAGAIIQHLEGKVSPEAQAAGSAFLAAERKLTNLMLRSGSGKELVERGFRDDVLLASQLNVSDCVPILQEGAYRIQSKDDV